jgi:hypothetical protein
MGVDQHGRYGLGWGFAQKNVLALMPITPRACLVAGAVGSSSRAVTAEDVWETNKAVIQCSVRFIYSHILDKGMNSAVQELAGSVRYGVDAFKVESFDVLELFG